MCLISGKNLWPSSAKRENFLVNYFSNYQFTGKVFVGFDRKYWQFYL